MVSSDRFLAFGRLSNPVSPSTDSCLLLSMSPVKTVLWSAAFCSERIFRQPNAKPQVPYAMELAEAGPPWSGLYLLWLPPQLHLF